MFKPSDERRGASNSRNLRIINTGGRGYELLMISCDVFRIIKEADMKQNQSRKSWLNGKNNR
jgi:hypothetical protein